MDSIYTHTCTHTHNNTHTHTHTHAGTCIDGQIRLIVGPDALSFYQSGNPSALYLDSDLDQLSRGRVEVCLGGQFGTVCSQPWSNKEASVVCRSLGYSPYGNAITFI